MKARIATALVSGVLLSIGTLPVSPASAGTVGKGPNGQRLSVSATSGIPLDGSTVTVTGSGYDVTKGIYVAFCLDNGAAAAPSPCGGGIDTDGSSGASHWISSNPPSYGEGLAVPYGPGGSFTVQLKITPRFGDVDCTTRRCVVSTRNDHTRGADRSQDVRVPVSFATAPASPTARATAAPATTATRSAAPPSVSAGGGPTSAPPASSATAANNPDAATGTGASAAASDQPLLTTQVSDSSPAGRWFNAVLAGLAAMLIVLVVLRARRWRRVKP